MELRHIASFEALLVSLEALPVPTDAHAAMSVAIPAPFGQRPRWKVYEEQSVIGDTLASMRSLLRLPLKPSKLLSEDPIAVS